MLADPKVESVEYPYSFLNDKLHGLRKGELVTVTAGTGIGKSTFVSEIAYDLLTRQNETVGYVALEENIRRTARRFVGMELDYPIHIDRGHFSDEQVELRSVKRLDPVASISTIILVLWTLPFFLIGYGIWCLAAIVIGSFLITFRFWYRALTKVTKGGRLTKQ